MRFLSLLLYTQVDHWQRYNVNRVRLWCAVSSGLVSPSDLHNTTRQLSKVFMELIVQRWVLHETPDDRYLICFSLSQHYKSWSIAWSKRQLNGIRACVISWPCQVQVRLHCSSPLSLKISSGNLSSRLVLRKADHSNPYIGLSHHTRISLRRVRDYLLILFIYSWQRVRLGSPVDARLCSDVTNANWGRLVQKVNRYCSDIPSEPLHIWNILLP